MSAQEQKDQELAPKKKKPFKLCFALQNLIGRSNIRIGKPLNLPSIITPKFYSKDIGYDKSYVDLKKQTEYLDIKGPRERYADPLTENQKYGWYQAEFTNLNKSDRRLYFGKQSNPIVKEHLMNYENIR